MCTSRDIFLSLSIYLRLFAYFYTKIKLKINFYLQIRLSSKSIIADGNGTKDEHG